MLGFDFKTVKRKFNVVVIDIFGHTICKLVLRHKNHILKTPIISKWALKGEIFSLRIIIENLFYHFLFDLFTIIWRASSWCQYLNRLLSKIYKMNNFFINSFKLHLKVFAVHFVYELCSPIYLWSSKNLLISSMG